MDKIKQAEIALEKAKKEAKVKKIQELQDVLKFCSGKCFKRTETRYYVKTIEYELVAEKIVTDIGYLENHLASEYLSVQYVRPGFTYYNGTVHYIGANNNLRAPIKKHYDHGVAITPATRNYYDYFRPKQRDKDGNIISDNNTIWEECGKEEFFEVKEKVFAFGAEFKKTFSKYSKEVIHTDGLVEVSPMDAQLMKKLFDQVKAHNITLADYIQIARKVPTFIPFFNDQLDELVQHSIQGERGLNLQIVSGDDGTDYEPYVTKYLIDYIDIKWEDVLYTIRTKLDSVLVTAKELRTLSCVYDTNNWEVTVFGSYDVTFQEARLSKSCLAAINLIIKNHLKL